LSAELTKTRSFRLFFFGDFTYLTGGVMIPPIRWMIVKPQKLKRFSEHLCFSSQKELFHF